jgi:ligand-binding sensor domain-containing protein/signal transduction histidine kinase
MCRWKRWGASIRAVQVLTSRCLRRSSVFSVTLLFALCGSGSLAASQGVVKLPVVEKTDLRFTHLASGEGQPHSRVGQIAQDDLGFLWFGTQDGLQRYDGYRSFREYRHDPRNPNSLAGSDSFALFKDRSGKLWVGSDEFLDRYDPETEMLTHYRSDPLDPGRFQGVLFDISQDHEGMLWLATDHGLNRLDPAKWQTVRYQNKPGDPTSLSSNLVRATFEEKDGTFWVATSEGLDIFDRRTGRVTRHFPLPDDFPRPGRSNPYLLISFCEDHSGVLWVTFSYGYGLAVVDRQANKLTFYSLNGAGTDNTLQSGVRAIHEDEDGTLWLGTTAGGLLKLDRDRKGFVRYRNNPSNPDSLSADQVNALCEDHEGNIWVGTTGGWVNRFPLKPLPFRRYRHEPGNPNSLDTDYTSSIYEDSQGILWVGSIRALTRIDRKTGKFTFYRTARGSGNLSSSWVISIREDHSGYLWFGTVGGGLNRFDRRTGRFKVYRHNLEDPHSLSHDTVLDLFVDHQGTLWAGTEDGLDALDPEMEGFRRYKASGEDQNRYRTIAEDSDGALWLGTLSSGLRRLDPATGQFTFYPRTLEAGGLSNERVNSICIDHSGNLWVATPSGLNRFDRATRSFASYDERDGLPNSNVNSILEDEHGDLWLSTNNGLSRFDPRAKTFRNYSVSDGLLGNEFYNYATAYRSSTGEMFFNSYAGVITFFPDQVVDNPYIPPVVLTDFLLFGKPVPIGGNSPLKRSISVTNSLTLTHAQSIFSFEFSALSYASPGRNRYRYRLAGLETKWNETDSSRRFVTYTTLAPGEYVFRVQGSNNRGVWNESGATVRIRILPPWWSTWKFRAAGGALMLVLLWVIYQLRLYQLTRQFNMRLEERVNERTRIARELHDTLLQSFHGLLLRFQTVSNLLPAGEAKQRLENAIEQAAQAITEGRDAVQQLRSSTVETNDLALAVRTLGEELAADQTHHNPAGFHVEVEGTPQNLRPILRDEVYRIAGEALRNAFRHAQARRIEVEIRYDERQLRLRVRDDGKGFDAKALKEKEAAGHYGLRGMRERAKHMGGKLAVWSELDSGTEVELSVPASNVYQTSGARRRSWLSEKLAAKDVEIKS